MSYAYTEDQEFFRRSVDRCLEREMDFAARRRLIDAGSAHSLAVWEAFAAMGLLGLPFPESRGGLGGSFMDLAAVSEAMGRRMSVEPFLSSVVLGGSAVAEAPATPERDALLAAVQAGEAHLAFAHEEDHGAPDPARIRLSATRAPGGDWLLAGEKKAVLGADLAGGLVTSVRTGGAPGDRAGIALVLVPADARGVSLRAYRTIDGRTGAHVRFDDVKVEAAAFLTPPEDGFPALERALRLGIVALCAEAVGAMGALLEATAAYASTRKQFGVAIGTFQALRHRIADMHMAHERARATLLVTATLLDRAEAGARDASVLKAQVGRLGRELGESAVQVHGAIGTTDELEIGHHLKRILAADALFGASRQHCRSIGAGAGNRRDLAPA